MKPYFTALLAGFFYNLAASSFNSLSALLVLGAGGGPGLVALTAMMIDTGFLVVSPYAGRLGDRLGRRRPLLLGFVLLALSAPLLLLAYRLRFYALFPLAGLIAGLAGGFTAPNLSMSVVELGAARDRRPEKPLSRLGLWGGIGWLVGLLSSSIFSALIGTDISTIVILSGSVLGLIVSATLPEPSIRLEPTVTAKPASPLQGIVERARLVYVLVTHPPLLVARLKGLTGFKLYVLGMSIAFTSIGLFFTQMPTYLKNRRGLEDYEIMLAASIHSLVSTVMYGVVYKITYSIGTSKLLLLGLGLRVGIFQLPILTEGIDPRQQAAVIYFFTGLTWSMISVSANSVAIHLVGMRKGGEAIGVLNSATSIGLLIGTMTSGIIAEWLGLNACFTSASLLMLIAVVVLAKCLITLKRE